MRVFVFEFVTGGGWRLVDSANPPSGSLLHEGQAMVEAVIADFIAVRDVDVVRMVDARHPQHDTVVQTLPIHGIAELRSEFTRAAANADYTLVIAPEFDDHLLNFTELVVQSGGLLLSPTPAFIRLTCDKHRTAQWLGNARVPTPEGLLLSPGKPVPSGFPFPAVLKPIEGAGSLDVQRIDSVAQLATSKILTTMRLERFHPGTPVSVVAIGGRNGLHLLPPCLQKISVTRDFAYLGGQSPIEDGLATRASRLAERAFRAMPRTTGYVGIDMILGDDPSGTDDVVIEVNPRLTTSYVGLRRLIRENLAAAMLSAARGEPFELSTHPHQVEFAADGTVKTIGE